MKSIYWGSFLKPKVRTIWRIHKGQYSDWAGLSIKNVAYWNYNPQLVRKGIINEPILAYNKLCLTWLTDDGIATVYMLFDYHCKVSWFIDKSVLISHKWIRYSEHFSIHLPVVLFRTVTMRLYEMELQDMHRNVDIVSSTNRQICELKWSSPSLRIYLQGNDLSAFSVKRSS